MARPLLGYYPVKRSDLYKDKELWTKTSGCLIKDFRHDRGGSPFGEREGVMVNYPIKFSSLNPPSLPLVFGDMNLQRSGS